MNSDNKPGQPNQQNKPFQNFTNALQKKEGEMGFDKYVAIALVVGLVAGFVVGHSIGGNKATDSKKDDKGNSMIYGEDATSTDASQAAAGAQSAVSALSVQSNTSNSVSVDDQKAGTKVSVSNISLGDTYWVAVRDNASSVKVPYVLGAVKLSAGTHANTIITLSRPLKAGATYDIVFYKDAPDFVGGTSNIIMNGTSVAQASFKAN
jgi:hypothetical protein